MIHDGSERLLESGIVKLRCCYPSRTVLRHDPLAVHPYVVHTEVLPNDGRPHYFITGGYHTELRDAVEEFGQRALLDLERSKAQVVQTERLMADIEAA